LFLPWFPAIQTELGFIIKVQEVRPEAAANLSMMNTFSGGKGNLGTRFKGRNLEQKIFPG